MRLNEKKSIAEINEHEKFQARKYKQLNRFSHRVLNSIKFPASFRESQMQFPRYVIRRRKDPSHTPDVKSKIFYVHAEGAAG